MLYEVWGREMSDVPDGLYYTKEHEWANFDNEVVMVGITDYAQSQLGDIIFFETPELGLVVKMGDIFGEKKKNV